MDTEQETNAEGAEQSVPQEENDETLAGGTEATPVETL
jgi:hypothetical protein